MTRSTAKRNNGYKIDHGWNLLTIMLSTFLWTLFILNLIVAQTPMWPGTPPNGAAAGHSKPRRGRTDSLSSARFSEEKERHQDFLVRRRRHRRHRRPAHIPTVVVAVSVLRVAAAATAATAAAIVRVCVMWVHLCAPAGERLAVRPSVRPSIGGERVRERGGEYPLPARSSGIAKAGGREEGEGRKRELQSNSNSSRLSSNLGRVTQRGTERGRKAALLTSTKATTTTKAVSAASAASAGAKREISIRPFVRPSVVLQSEAVGPKSWGKTTSSSAVTVK